MLTPERAYAESPPDRAVSQTRPPLVCGDAAFCVCRPSTRCSRSAGSSWQSTTTCDCRRTSMRTPPRFAESSRLFPWASDYLAIYERYQPQRRPIGDGAQRSRDAVGNRAAGQRGHRGCPLSRRAMRRSAAACFPLRRHIDAGVTCALGTDVGGGLGFGMLKEGLHAYLMQRLAPDPKPLDAARLLYLATKAGAEALGLRHGDRRFPAGKAADFVYLRPPRGQRARVGRSACGQRPAGARRRCSPWRVRRACAKFASRATSYIPIDRSHGCDDEDLNARSRADSSTPLDGFSRARRGSPNARGPCGRSAALDALHDAMVAEVARRTPEEQLGLAARASGPGRQIGAPSEQMSPMYRAASKLARVSTR